MKANHTPAMGLAPSAATSRFNPALVLALVLAFLMAAGGFWWMCARNETVAFLPRQAGAEWIVFPKQAEGTQHDAITVTVAFQYSFTLTSQPAAVTLAVAAFKGATVAINGREVGSTPGSHRNWKLPSRAEVAGLLQPGTNVITAWVTNAIGPPALWLLLQSPQFSLGTGERWQVSLNGTEWQSARRALQPPDLPPDSPLYGGTRMMDRLKRVWPLEAAFCVVALALVWGMHRWLSLKRLPGGTLPTTTSTKLIYSLLVIVLLARAALFINNILQLPRSVGFDAVAHEEYIQFIQQKHALPLADDGWEMFQPPLYYLTSALVLDGCGRSVGDADAVYFLRAVNGVIGLLHCWVVLLCLRLLFGGNLQAQAAGLLVAAFLPPHLYLSQYVTNEPLAGFLVTVAIYLCLRVLRAEKAGLWMPIGIGAALGAAMLTKVSALLALPVFALALSQKAEGRRQTEEIRRQRSEVGGQSSEARRQPSSITNHKSQIANGKWDWLRSVSVVVVVCLIVCGWHYGRVWARFGKPIVGNWDTQSGQEWWIEPGFVTSAYFLSFGRVLTSPSFSGFHSFADGIYSTLWGDGLASGTSDYRHLRPPWNYDLVGAGYWASLGISLLLILGAALVLAKIMRRSRGEWLLVVGMVGSFGLGLVWFSLRHPDFACSKAFYAFSALLPFSALVAVGWDWLRQRHRAAGIAVWVLLLVWSMTVYTSFWVRNANPATQLVRTFDLGSALLRQGRLDEAIGQYREALRLKPDYAKAHYDLGVALGTKGRTDEAIGQYQEALRLKPDYAEAHNNLGCALGLKGQTDEAIHQFQETLRLKPEQAEAHYNLAVALSQKGQTDEAIRQLQETLRLQPEHVQAHNTLGGALYQRGRAGEAIREFQEALRLRPDYAEARKNLIVALAAQSSPAPVSGAATNR